jgi:hypothetical protein
MSNQSANSGVKQNYGGVTVARTLMSGTGHAVGVAGTAMSGLVTMLVIRSILNFSTDMVIKLPHIMTTNTSDFYSTINDSAKMAIVGQKTRGFVFLISAGVMGMSMRKFGTFLTDEHNLDAVEYFFYGKNEPTDSELS